MGQAVEGSYHSKGYKRDGDLVDMAYLILHVGGPMLLSAMHKAGVMPSVSWVLHQGQAPKMRNFFGGRGRLEETIAYNLDRMVAMQRLFNNTECSTSYDDLWKPLKQMPLLPLLDRRCKPGNYMTDAFDGLHDGRNVSAAVQLLLEIVVELQSIKTLDLPTTFLPILTRLRVVDRRCKPGNYMTDAFDLKHR
ncbi:hypothetical protein GPECTOR_101g36 [Gonium pectorale]|uniref:Uncharacterized protein n=1 Tax=Gonium pectorale TaxID=33097 RepID=A0A150G109_GONPE|nr:hypothetical protein GPECTOR_101g36 [Gonium pectorale]|eukprot:KXZ43135.1 hypothetical protein GPECTOR_101g36 [Gonium pectorale]